MLIGFFTKLFLDFLQVLDLLKIQLTHVLYFSLVIEKKLPKGDYTSGTLRASQFQQI